MTPILLLLAFPLLVVAVMRIWKPETFSWTEAGVQAVLTVVLVVGGYQGGKALKMQSVEFWTGTITNKTSQDGHYQTSYDCNCRTTGSGNNKTTTCDTCYEDHYTREWILGTSMNRNIITSNIDTTSRMRRDGFDADVHWVDAYIGEACSITNSYTNYVAAAESSLHHRSGSPETWAKKGLLPDYPQLHGVYHLHRVHDLTGKVANLDKWRLRLDEFMGTLGALKQINLFVYFVPTADQSYRHALQAHWNGANKNDTIIVIGIPDGKTIEMVEVVTWAKSDLYRQELIDGITDFGSIEADSFEPVLHLVNDRTLKHYERRPMADFAHLEKEIKPPTWMMVILVIIAIPGSLALAYVFHVIDLDAMLRRRGGGSFRRSSGIRIRRRRF